MRFGQSGYHEDNFNPRLLKQRVERIHRALKRIQKKVPFDAIAFMGVSGSAVAYPLSAMFGWHLLHVRRKETRSHGSRVEGSNRLVKRYLILDDFMVGGRTIDNIMKGIDRIAKVRTAWDGWDEPECVAIVFYNDCKGARPETYKMGRGRGKKALEVPVFCLKRG